MRAEDISYGISKFTEITGIIVGPTQHVWIMFPLKSYHFIEAQVATIKMKHSLFYMSNKQLLSNIENIPTSNDL